MRRDLKKKQEPPVGRAPQIPDDLEALVVREGDGLNDLSEVAMNGAQLAGSRPPSLLLSQSRLTNVDLSASVVSRLRTIDVTFKDCNLSNVESADAQFLRVVFAECKLSGFGVTAGSFTDVEFRGCRLDFASLAEVKFKRVTFHDCRLRDADFSGTTLENVRFVACDLTRAMFGNARIEGSQMLRCDLTDVRELRDLRGIAMEWNDVLALAHPRAAAFGIEVTGAGFDNSSVI